MLINAAMPINAEFYLCKDIGVLLLVKINIVRQTKNSIKKSC